MTTPADLRHVLAEDTIRLTSKFLDHVTANRIPPDKTFSGPVLETVNYKLLGLFPRTKSAWVRKKFAGWQVPGLDQAYILDDGSYFGKALYVEVPAAWSRNKQPVFTESWDRLESFNALNSFGEYIVELEILGVLHAALVAWNASVAK